MAVLSESGKGGIWKPCYYSLVKENLLNANSLNNAAKNISFSNQEETSGVISKGIVNDEESPGQIVFTVNCKPEANYIFSLQFKPFGKSLYKLPLSIHFYTGNNKTDQELTSASLGPMNLSSSWHTLEKTFKTPPKASKLVIKCSIHCTVFFLKDIFLREL